MVGRGEPTPAGCGVVAAGVLEGLMLEPLSASHAGGGDQLVALDPDHPGFRDPIYRARRNAIAKLALEHREGQLAPYVAYTEVEHDVWRSVWAHLTPLHAARAVREW